ncbi:outer membrane protein transport protein [Robertkochia aurantiaca]|uniref:outer membrane protein transport protein n=1 Tax=Robertkochia aurantiaca TaxID=2873700 RepID=UPI001CCCB9C2|nr:outer membrane protein transport protein [Robertkochia sp. 3YJGBD-33]
MQKESSFLIIVSLTLLLTCLPFSKTSAQQADAHPIWSNVSWGGNIGLGFGNDFFSATLAPSGIYNVNPKLAVGLGLNFTYASERDFYNSTVIGGSLIGLYSPIREIQLSAELEELHVNRRFDDRLIIEDEQYWYPALFLGAGYNTGPVTIGARYDVLYDEARSIYGSALMPFVRVYF